MNLKCRSCTGDLEEDEKKEAEYEVPREAAAYEIPVLSSTVSLFKEKLVRD